MKKRFPLLLIISLVGLGGIGTKYYSGPLRIWVNDSLGGVFYEIFFCLLITLLFSNSRPVLVSCGVFSMTCLLEFLQLWHPSVLTVVRRTYFGAMLLGTTFVWSDFMYYIIGCSIGYGILEWFKKAKSDHS